MSGRVAVVTGGANGIGAAVVARLAAAGHAVAILDQDQARLDGKASELRERHGARVFVRALDVRKSDEVSAAFSAIRAELGPVAIQVNSVGGSTPQRPIEDITDEEFDAQLALNLRTAFLCTRAVVPGMKAAKWGRIVNVSSVAGRTRSLFGGAHYTATKAAVIGLTRQVAHEVGPFGVTANVVAPGVTLSARVALRWEAKSEQEREFITNLIPAKRCADVDEPAAAIAFLCTEEAGYVNGATLDVNGGLFIG